MTTGEMILLAGGAVVMALTIWGIIAVRRGRRDEIFADLTPGQFPPPGATVRREKVPGTEYAGPVAVQFAPPAGVAPGLAGTVVDGKADGRDVTATIIDLAVRGYLKITPLNGPQTEGQPAQPQPQGKSKGKEKPDWLLARSNRPAGQELARFESLLLHALFSHGPQIRMSDLSGRHGQALKDAQVELYREVVNQNWYKDHPRAGGKGVGCLGVVMLVVGIPLMLLLGVGGMQAGSPIGWIAGGLVVASAIALLVFGGRGRTPRTAEGTAVRIQTLGFQQYIATAEANQIKFEEAADIFSRYLPYAIVFGLADRWAKLFGEVAKRAKHEGYDVGYDLTWFDVGYLVMDGLTDAIILADLLDAGSLFEGLEGLDIGEALGGVTDGIGEFVGSGDGIGGLLDGCDLDGCDGCDL